jgi:hypothetical protein
VAAGGAGPPDPRRVRHGRRADRVRRPAAGDVRAGRLVLWTTGLVASLRSPRRPWQPVLAWAWIAVLAVFVVTAGQGTTRRRLYPPLIAAGAVVLQDRWPSRRAGTALVAAAVLLALAPLPSALPVLPPPRWPGAAGGAGGEPAGDGRLAGVRGAGGRRPPRRARGPGRRGRVHLELRRGGAVELLGPAQGLPAAYSGHNAYADWGPPPASARYAVVVSPGDPPEVFAGCVRTAPSATPRACRRGERGGGDPRVSRTRGGGGPQRGRSSPT